MSDRRYYYCKLVIVKRSLLFLQLYLLYTEHLNSVSLFSQDTPFSEYNTSPSIFFFHGDPAKSDYDTPLSPFSSRDPDIFYYDTLLSPYSSGDSANSNYDTKLSPISSRDPSNFGHDSPLFSPSSPFKPFLDVRKCNF